MIWRRRQIGPRQPNLIARMWAGMILAAPVRLWAQILGFGSVLGVVVYVLHRIFVTINLGGTPHDLALVLAKGAIQIAQSLVFLAVIQVVAITELKVGFNASKDGLHADLQREDDDPPKG